MDGAIKMAKGRMRRARGQPTMFDETQIKNIIRQLLAGQKPQQIAKGYNDGVVTAQNIINIKNRYIKKGYVFP